MTKKEAFENDLESDLTAPTDDGVKKLVLSEIQSFIQPSDDEIEDLEQLYGVPSNYFPPNGEVAP